MDWLTLDALGIVIALVVIVLVIAGWHPPNHRV
jgi:hypothetical protein